MSWTVDDIGTQTGRVAIVTGANSGIGFETAKTLADRGATVILACRNSDKASAALAKITGDVAFMRLDLSSLESVRTFATAFGGEYQHLDLLINNAGVMTPPLTHSQEGFELQFATNHLGHFALTGRLMPLIRDRGDARVVTVSSIAHKFGRVDFDNLCAEKGYRATASYAQSKLANLLFTHELERRLRRANARAIAVGAHPGWTATNLQANNLGARLGNPLIAMKPAQGALPSLMAATAPQVNGGTYFGPTGLWELRGRPGVVRASNRSQDREVAEKLWDVSVEATGVDFGLA